ncbi:MAG: ion transporter [Methanoregula sp.]|nr:ion transporter [Methanoregula sp.]
MASPDEGTNARYDLSDLKDPGYEIFIILISVLSILNAVISWVPGIDPDALRVIGITNAFLTIIFIADFLYRFFTAGSKRYYFFRDWGWADLLASIPALRILRFFRIVKAYIMLRKYGVRDIASHLRKRPAETMFYVILFAVLVVIETGAFLVLMFERYAADANIQTASDALWWTCVTITTVGYGDRYPVTNAGRMAGIGVMAMGVVLIGTLAGFIANKLVAPGTAGTDSGSDPPRRDPEKGDASSGPGRNDAELLARLDRIEQELKKR